MASSHSSSSASPHLPAKAHAAPVIISRSASPRPQSVHGPSLAAPHFLATLSPRKSAALTETSKSLALADAIGSGSSSPLGSPSISTEDGSKFSLGGSRLIEEEEAVNETLEGPGREERPAKLSLRLGSAMDTTLAPVDTAAEGAQEQSDPSFDLKVTITNGADEGSQTEGNSAGNSETQRRSHPPEVMIEVTRPSEERDNGSAKDDEAMSHGKPKETETEDAKGSAWTSWTSRAASGSFSFLKQSTSTAAGWGSTLTTNPFRGSGKEREPAATLQAEAGPSRPRSTAESDDDDDAAMAKSAADTLRIGAKNEEKRRAAQARLQQKKDKAKVVDKRSTGERGRQDEGSLVPPRLASEADASLDSRSSSPIIRGLNTFDYVEALPGACDAPTTEILPERRYFILTQAGKPVFLSHLAARRLEREDAARARLKALRQAERERDRQRVDLPEGSEGRTDKLALLDREDSEARAQEDAARKRDEVASDEDEEDSAVQVGVLQALISNYFDKGLAVLESKSIEILQLPRASSRVIFLMRGPLYLAVTSTWHDGGRIYSDSATVLKAHLEVLHAGLISLISDSQLKGLFARGHNFDLRRMLEGTDGILSSLVARCQVDFGLILGAGGGGGICLRPTRLDLKLREDLGSCLSLERWENRPLSRVLAEDSGRSSPLHAPESPNGDTHHLRSNSPRADLDPSKLKLEFKIPARPKDLLYILLITADGQLITMLRPRRLSAYPLDLHLLMNTIVGMSRRTQREPGTVNWIPICLPRFAPQGMVQAHISWLHGDPQQHEKRTDRQDEEEGSSESAKDGKRKAECALVIVTADRESFDEIGTWRDGVVKALSLPPSPLASLSHALTQAPISPDSLRLPGLRHFVLKRKDDLQIIWSEWIEPYAGDTPEALLARDRVRKTYARARELSILGAKMGKSGKKTRKAKEAAAAGTAGRSAKPATRTAPAEKQAVVLSEGEVAVDTIDKGAEEDKTPEVEDPEDTPSATSTSTPKDGDSAAEEASAVTIPSALLPQANVTSHYFRTPHEAFYIEVPPAPTTSHLTGPLVVDPDSASPYEVYLTLSSNVPPATAKKIARQVVRWGLGSGGGGGGDAVAGERWRLFVSGRGMVF